MTNSSRAMWTEGMLLGPHHFQQQDRFLLSTISAVSTLSSPYPYGLTAITIDESALSEGRFSLLACDGYFADGTPFSLPEHGPLPSPVDVAVDDVGKVISLGLPFESHSVKDVAEKTSRESFARYLLRDGKIADRHSPDSDTEETVFTAEIWTRLLLAETDQTAFHTLPLVKVKNIRDDGTVILDDQFFPCAVTLSASAGINRLCKETLALLTQRASDLAGRLGRPDTGDVTQLTQFFLLQIINRVKPLFEHIVATPTLHPEIIYRELIQLSGELATICTPARLAPVHPDYNHRDQFSSFNAVAVNVREYLNWIPQSSTASLPVEHVKGGIYTATVHDINLFRSARFVLAVSARVPPEELRQNFIQQTTVSSKDKLRDLVVTHSQGVSLEPMLTVPNSIPMYDQYLFFEFDRSAALWSEISVSGVIAIHIAGNYPELNMQLWTVNQ